MNNKNQNQNLPTRNKFNWLVIISVFLLAISMFYFLKDTFKEKPIPISSSLELQQEIQNNYVESIRVIPSKNFGPNRYTIEGRFSKNHQEKNKQNRLFEFTLVQESEVSEIRNLMHQYNKPVSNQTASRFNFLSLLLNLLPLIFMIWIVTRLFRNLGQSNNQAFDFAKSKARLIKNKTVTFKDVAGCDEEKFELEEIIDFLKDPKKYVEIGARIPKGVLLVGAPGTGKTLLAKAVAGEAKVPFFSISGSDFVEMFVGVGASRVRDLFTTAKKNAPCIVFIDEIDAVGRQRGSGIGGGHDEREQTLNQLLVEMDGFNPNSGIIIMAATNRPDVLDPALLRPGRFDREITIDLPDVKARTEILKVHARNKILDQNIKLSDIAQRIPGFSGADIENLLNESALLAARKNRKIITINDIDECIDRVLMGPAKTSRKYSEKEKNVVAYHEAGHAVIGLKLEKANEVQKITIIPRGRAGGYNLMTPKEETFLKTKQDLLAVITGYLGGRAAEEVVFGEITTGGSNDFENATRIARAMVTEYGMSDLGPIQYERPNGDVFLGRDYLKDKNFSDKIAHDIDIQIHKIIDSCHKTAVNLIKENRTLLDNIVKYLLKLETITKQQIKEILNTGSLKDIDLDETKENKIKKDEEKITSTKKKETKKTVKTTKKVKKEN